MQNKKNYTLIALVLGSSFAFAQVGINTDTPQATLEVVGKGDTTTAKDGIIPPKVTKQQLAAKTAGTYGLSQTGALVYVTDVTAPTGTTPSLTQVAGITAIGNYYFNGTGWVASSPAAAASTNIYNADGTLTANRTVTQNANRLAFNGTAANAFSVNSASKPLFSANASNNRIGMGTTNPGGKLEIISDNGEGGGPGNDFNFFGYGDAKNPGIALLSANGTSAVPTALVAGDRLGTIDFLGRTNSGYGTSSIIASYRGDGNTNATDLGFFTTGTERIRVTPTGEVGIATMNPQGIFHVDAARDNAVTGAPTTGQQANDVIITSAGRVGIGTTSPAELLDVTGKTKTSTFQMTTGATDGYVLVSDGSGNGTWKNLQDISVKKTLGTPPAGSSASYSIPCAAGFDIIQLTNSDANFATTINLPSPSCSTPGQKVRVVSTSNTIATISKSNTNVYGTTKLSIGDVYEYTLTNGLWELTSFPTKNWHFCRVPNNGATTLINPETPKTLFYFYNGCYNSPVTLPSGGSLGDILIIDDAATLNLTIKQANTTMASDYVLVTGSYVQFIKTNLGWVKQF